jgi:aerobic C4-dicarboxylate transport protein
MGVSSDETQTDAPKRRGLRGNLYVQVIAAIVLGGAIGHFYPKLGESLQPLGTGFIALVKMIIGPVIFLTVVSGIAGMRDLKGLGGVMARAMTYFLVVSTLALVVGLVVANVVKPGAGMNIDPASLDGKAIQKFTGAAHDQTVVGFILNIIPKTFISGFADGDILQVLFVSVLFGVAAALAGDRARPIVDVLESAAAAIFKLVHILMKAAPIGAFGAFAFTIGRYGLDSIANLAVLVATFYLTSAAFVVFVLGLIGLGAGFSIFRLISYLREEIMLVLGTSSSEAALPSLMEKMEAAGFRKSIVGVVVPTGYSFNLDGTNIYMTLAALFIAQATGIELPLEEQLLLLAVAMLSSKGAAGVTGAGFITLAATLAVVPSVPVAGMAMLLGVDRFMSECRAITNFIGNAVATVVVSRWQGGVDMPAFNVALGGVERGRPRLAVAIGVGVLAIVAGAALFIVNPSAAEAALSTFSVWTGQATK